MSTAIAHIQYVAYMQRTCPIYGAYMQHMAIYMSTYTVCPFFHGVQAYDKHIELGTPLRII